MVGLRKKANAVSAVPLSLELTILQKNAYKEKAKEYKLKLKDASWHLQKLEISNTRNLSVFGGFYREE